MSIIIHNFSLTYNAWLPITDLAVLSVDVIDPVYSISVSGTKFYYNDQLVSGTFNDITNGYKISYTQGTVSSGVDILVHAENSNGEQLDKTYNLLFGYRVEYDEPINWGAHKQVDVYMKAKNTVLCPNEETEAFYFKTSDYYTTNFTAKVYPVAPKDLGATLKTQSTFFYYGQTYQITVDGIKDFNGNAMEPYTFTFTIEDPTGD